eukprot:4029215-Pleurochrysis_carterae.AAC.10
MHCGNDEVSPVVRARREGKQVVCAAIGASYRLSGPARSARRRTAWPCRGSAAPRQRASAPTTRPTRLR